MAGAFWEQLVVEVSGAGVFREEEEEAAGPHGGGERAHGGRGIHVKKKFEAGGFL